MDFRQLKRTITHSRILKLAFSKIFVACTVTDILNDA